MYVSDLKREFYDVILGKVGHFSISVVCKVIIYFSFLFLACPDICKFRRGCNMLMSNSAVPIAL